jgi:hypothetical protein
MSCFALITNWWGFFAMKTGSTTTHAYIERAKSHTIDSAYNMGYVMEAQT